MAFDRSTAKPIVATGFKKFDPSTARPAAQFSDQDVSSDSDFLPFAGTSVGAIGQSGAEYLGNTAQAILHPIQTAQGIGNMALGAAQKFVPGTQPQEVYADAVGEFVKNRYKNFDAFRETWKRDPVGVAADAATILTGGGALVGKVGTASKLSTMARVGQGVGRAGQVLDPLTVTLQAAKLPGRALSRGMQATGASAINQLIKPSNRQFAFGKNPGMAVAKEGIVASSLEDLAAKVGQRRQSIGQQIGQAMDIPQVSSQTVNVADSLSPINESIQTLRKNPRTNASAIQRLENLRDDLLGVVVNPDGTETLTRDLTKMKPRQVFELKQMVGDLTKWTENISDDAVANASLKKVYSNLRGSIERVVPGVKSLNERYANLLEAERAAKNQAYASMRRTPFGLPEMILGGPGVVSGRFDAAIMGVLLAQGARAALKSPYIRTQLAQWMQRASPTEVNAFMNRIPGLKTEMTRTAVLAGTGQQRVQNVGNGQ